MEGISIKRLNDTIQALYENGLHGYVLMRHGKVLSKGWVAPYEEEGRHLLFSLTKSFTSTAMGFLVQEGKVTVEDKVVSFFPELLEGRPCENMEKMRIKDLLMMATGHVDQEPPIVSEDGRTAIKNFLYSYVQKTPGTHFLYNTAATGVLAYIIEKVAGESVESYLKPRLFDVLGITNYRWQRLPDGVCVGGFGLSMSAADFARFGQFLLQKGVWEGKQILNAQWIKDATCAQIIQQDGEGNWGAGYGYQFWRNTKENSYRGDGAFGQFMVVIPEKDIVWASSSGSNDIGKQLETIFDMLIAFVDQDADESGEVTMPEIPFVSGEKSSEMAADISKNTYVIQDNPDHIEAIRFNFEDETVAFKISGEKLTYSIGYQTYLQTHIDEDVMKEDTEYHCHVAATGAWESADTYHVRLVHIYSPFITDITARFVGDGVLLTVHENVGFDNKPRIFNGIKA